MTGRSREAGIGEVLDPKAGSGMREWTHANPCGDDDVNRPPEILHTECVVTEESCPSSGIDGDTSLPAAQHKIRHDRHHQTALMCPGQ